MCIGRLGILPPCAGVPKGTPAPAKAGGWNYEGITQNALDEIFRARLPHLVSVHSPSGLILPRRTPGWTIALRWLGAPSWSRWPRKEQSPAYAGASSDGAKGLLGALGQAPGAPPPAYAGVSSIPCGMWGG